MAELKVKSESNEQESSLWTRFCDHLLDIMSIHFHNTYQPDGVVMPLKDVQRRYLNRINRFSVDGTIDIKINSSRYQALEKYCNDPRTILSYFIGLPNHPSATLEQSWANLFYNLIGWETRNTHWRMVNNFCFPVFLLLNLIAMPFKAILNTAKLFTEFLPSLAFHHFWSVFQEAKSRDQTQRYKVAENLWHYFKLISSIFLMVILFPLMELGFATTSPIESVKFSWKVGKEKGGYPVALLAASVSIFLTMGIYTTLFPFIIQPVVASLFPFLATHLPLGIVNAANAVAGVLSPVLTAIGITISPWASSAIAMSPSLAAVGLFTAVICTTVGIKFNQLYTDRKNSWNCASFPTILKTNDDNHPTTRNARAGSLAFPDGSGNSYGEFYRQGIEPGDLGGIELTQRLTGESVLDDSDDDNGELLYPWGTPPTTTPPSSDDEVNHDITGSNDNTC